MLTNIYNFLKNNTRIEMVMSVVLLAAVTVIACNMDKVTKKDQNKIQQSEMKKNITPNGKTVDKIPGKWESADSWKKILIWKLRSA